MSFSSEITKSTFADETMFWSRVRKLLLNMADSNCDQQPDVASQGGKGSQLVQRGEPDVPGGFDFLLFNVS